MTYIFFTDTSLSKCVSITNQKAKYTDFSNINFRAGGLNHFSILLNVNYKDTGEDGYPIVSSHFDDASKAMALQHYITNWSMAVDAVTLENTVADMENQMMDDMPPPPPEIDDEDNPFDDLD